MRRSTDRATGSIDQPTSWPWVLATTRRRPGLPGTLRQQRQRRGRAEPDGVDAVLGDQPAHPGVDAGTGSISVPGWRTT